MTDAELFAIRYRINQVIYIANILHIIVVTDAIHLVKKIFDLLTYPYQMESIAVVQDLRSSNDSISNLLSHVNFHGISA